MPSLLTPADILLPAPENTDLTRYACIACDQFTSEPAYWEEVEKTVGDAPSALRLILPECYLGKETAGEEKARITAIHTAMRDYRDNLLTVHKDSMVYLRRTDSHGHIREGLIGKIDLEDYDYLPGAKTPIRATEGTVLSRIPPRVRVRRDAPLELPHVMLLFSDKEDRLFSFLRHAPLEKAYDFPLMSGGGRDTGFFLSAEVQSRVSSLLDALTAGTDFAFAVGDGNHSLATAKACYEELKKNIGAEKAAAHPARYALVELVNLFDASLVFEPIYRLLSGSCEKETDASLAAWAAARTGETTLRVLRISEQGEREFLLPAAEGALPVAVLQEFLDSYTAAHPEITPDYIHGEDSLRALATRPGAVGFLFAGMRKEELFPAVAQGGSLPRKTFSMGDARDKRYYLEARAITE